MRWLAFSSAPSSSCHSAVNKAMTNPVLLTKGKMAAANTQATAVQPLPDGRMQLFTQLKPYTSQLLRARDLPARLQGLLRSLQSVIRDADVDALNSRGIFDYILFPLMPGVDSIVLLRRPGVWSMYAAPVRHALCHVHTVQLCSICNAYAQRMCSACNA